MSTSTQKTIRIATSGVAKDYRQSLVPLIIQSLGYRIEWTEFSRADLLIIGPFFKPTKKLRWLPKPLRPAFEAMVERLQTGHRTITLFQTGENLRHNHIPCDYSLSFDLAVDDLKHCRLPYWMELVDWSHEGIFGNLNPRFGRLLSIEQLMRPLGREFLEKPKRVAIFASHLQEPRATLINAVARQLPVQGFGPAFDTAIGDHSRSNFTKLEVLKGFAFNLCPENSMYPGYYTEKIPESISARSLPITWTDANVVSDFNPKAMINLAPMTHDNFQDLAIKLTDRINLESYAAECLLLHRPTLEKTKQLIKEAVTEALL